MPIKKTQQLTNIRIFSIGEIYVSHLGKVKQTLVQEILTYIL